MRLLHRKISGPFIFFYGSLWQGVSDDGVFHYDYDCMYLDILLTPLRPSAGAPPSRPSS